MKANPQPRPERKTRPLRLENLEDRLAPAGIHFREQVADLYRLGLNREPDSAGLNHFVAQLRQGAPLSSVVNSILNSPEHHQKLVVGFFKNFLERQPTAGEVKEYVGALNAGVPEEKVLAKMCSTLPHATNQEYVTFLYNKILNRQPDPSGMAHHLQNLQAGVSRYATALRFLESPGFSKRITTAIFKHIYEANPTSSELTNWTNRLARPDYGFNQAFVSAVSSARGQQVISQKSNTLMAIPLASDESSPMVFGISAMMYPGMLDSVSADVTKLVNQIRAVETFSSPTNPGQIVAGLQANKFPDPDAVNDDTVKTTGTNGLDAYPGDGRNTPGAFQMDLANLDHVFGIWGGKAGSAKNASPYDTQIAFSQSTLANYFGIQVDANGFITQIGKTAASVFLHNEAVALNSSFDPSNNPLIGLNINNFQSEQLSLLLAGRSPLDPTTAMATNTRVAPQDLLDMDTTVQNAVARAFIWNSYNNAYIRSSSGYNATYLKAVGLFGSTMKITGSTSAFGVNAGDPFLCQFNPGFIIGGGYVRGFNEGGVYDIIKAVVDADANGKSSFTVEDLQGTNSLNVAPAGGSANGVAVTGNEIGYVGFAPGQTTETYTVKVVTGGAYGTAKLSVTSSSGTDTPSAVITPVSGVPIKVGTRGLLLTFTGGTFAAGASWTATVTQVSKIKTITITKSIENGVKVFSVDRTPVNVGTEYPSIFHYGAIMSLYQVDMSKASDWGVDTSAYDHGYTSSQTAVEIKDTATAPTGGGSYGIAYSNLGSGKTLTLTGGDNYFVAPPVVQDPSGTNIKVDNTGYMNGGNNGQNVSPGNKIDMSAYGTTMASAYPNFFYVYTSSGADVVKHVSDATVPSNLQLRMYYIPGANGSVATAQQAVTNGDFSKWSPYKDSYRVLLANLAVMGTPTSASDWGTHFIMTPPPPPLIGTGTFDASNATGSLFLSVDNSIALVKLGSGSNFVVENTVNTPVTYVLNPDMASGTARSSFSGLKYGADMISLKGFTNVANLQVDIGPSFDNKSNSAAIEDYYTQFSSTAMVSFDSDVSGSTQTYLFEVLLNSHVNNSSSQWQTMVTSSIQTS